MTTRRRLGARGEDGYVALTVALLFSSVFLGLAAIGVDVARWYVEAERVQNAADSAALAGVVFMPDNFTQASLAARDNARVNGYSNGVNARVIVSRDPDRRSRLRVQITTEVANQFGAAIGVDTASVGRSAVADYTSPAPMGSPCNTFGNEPTGGNNLNSGPAAQQGNCGSRPNFWAAIEGPNMDKISGDRYSTINCANSATPTYGCASATQKNNEGPQSPQGHPEGYFFAVKIGTPLVGKPVRLQIFDPVYYPVATACTDNLPDTSIAEAPNKYTSDGKTRFRAGAGSSFPFCTGDTSQGSGATFTSFALREATDSVDPLRGAGVSGCPPIQFRGYSGRLGANAAGTTGVLTSTNNSGTVSNRYDDGFAKTFRQWVDMCTFYPKRAGTYFIQTRTNVELGGTPDPNTNSRLPVIYRNNPKVLEPAGSRTAGDGANAFALRAVANPSNQVTVSGWARMPMLQNAPNETAEFHMLRVLPSAAGQTISFRLFDVADIPGGKGKGTVTVLPPADATGTIRRDGLTGCTESLNLETERPVSSGCTVNVSGAANNGQVQNISIPIPSDYSCNPDTQTNCWFKVQVALNSAITDFTTWDASLLGDPVRLIE